MAKVVLENVSKYFGKVKAVDNVNLEIADKEFLTLLGPSGCGKTTTLNLVAGLEVPTVGRIYIGDKSVNDLSAKDRNVAVVFQSYALYPHMSVFGNMAFPLRMRKTAKAEVRRKVEEVASLLGLHDLLDRKPKELSGGQKQRVALGRAMVRDPNVFLLDEPLSNLDARLRVHMRMELKRLQKELGTTTIYVTHDQVEAMTMSRRIAVMNYGQVVQVGTPEEIFDQPKDLFVATFLGSPPMNLLACRLVRDEGKAFLEWNYRMEESFRIDMSEVKGIEEEARKRNLVLGIRPEDIHLHKTLQPSSVKGEVYITEPLGRELVIDVRVGDELIRVRFIPEFNIDAGDTVWMTFDTNRFHLFDKDTNKAIF